MDVGRFDHLAKTFARIGSRREMVRQLLAAALGGAGVALTVGESEAGKQAGGRPGGKRHGRNRGHGHGRRRKHRRTAHKRKDKGDACAADASSTACCGDGLRCLNGACMPAYATIAECGGRVDCAGCPGDTDPAIDMCGVAVRCPSSSECLSQTGCGGNTFLSAGPDGPSYYCVSADGSSCDANGSCPGEQVCGPGTFCFTVCT